MKKMALSVAILMVLSNAHALASTSSAHALASTSRHGPVMMKRTTKRSVKSAGSSAGKGFGSGSSKPAPIQRPQKTLDELVAGYETRLPAEGAMCACCSGIPYEQCCRPYHVGDKVPETPTRTLQTRFTAFAYRLPAVLIRTTHPTNNDYDDDRARWARRLHREGMFDGFRFEKLEAKPEEAGTHDNEAFVAFRATLVPRDGGAPQSFLERSQFLRDEEAGWLYGHGDVTSDGGWLEVEERGAGRLGIGAQLLETARRSVGPSKDDFGDVLGST
jgi:SEC-C motif-containing protein